MLKEYSTEIKVGALVFAALALGGVFLWLLGDYTPIGRTYNVYVEYNFAGGVELGTPVRLSGIKVGKVTHIEFLPPPKTAPSDKDVSLKLKLNISRTVRHRVRADSKFFINQAGIIGERYIEITPGTAPSPEIQPFQVVRGTDPPRFDQMISQGMGVFGDVAEILEKNRDGIQKATEALMQAAELLSELTSKMSSEDINTLRRMLRRADNITEDLEIITHQLRWDLRPTLADIRRLVREATPVLRRANRLLTDLEDMARKLRDLPEDKKKEISKIFERMTETASQLQDMIARLDAFTAMVQDQYSDLDRIKIEKIIRRFLQEEGVRINVGEVKLRTREGFGK